MTNVATGSANLQANNVYDSPEYRQCLPIQQRVPVHRYRKSNTIVPLLLWLLEKNQWGIAWAWGYSPSKMWFRIDKLENPTPCCTWPAKDRAEGLSRWSTSELNTSGSFKSWLTDLYREAPSSADAKTVFGSSKSQWTFSRADLMPERRELATLAGFYNMHSKGGSSVAQCFMRRLRIKDSWTQ